MTDEEIEKTEKSLKWVVNQIPDNLGDSNEDKMLKCIRLYCNNGVEAINSLKSDNADLTVKLEAAETDRENLLRTLEECNIELQDLREKLYQAEQKLAECENGYQGTLFLERCKHQSELEQALQDRSKEILIDIKDRLQGLLGCDYALEVINDMLESDGVEVDG